MCVKFVKAQRILHMFFVFHQIERFKRQSNVCILQHVEKQRYILQHTVTIWFPETKFSGTIAQLIV